MAADELIGRPKSKSTGTSGSSSVFRVQLPATATQTHALMLYVDYVLATVVQAVVQKISIDTLMASPSSMKDFLLACAISFFCQQSLGHYEVGKADNANSVSTPAPKPA